MDKKNKARMKEFRNIAIVTFIAFIALAMNFGYLSIQSIQSGLQVPQCQNVTVTKIASLYNSIYPSAIDKFGTGGACVALLDVKVLQVNPTELDGDTHITLGGSNGKEIEMEITPFSKVQYNVSTPIINTSIDVIGFYYCDYVHKNQTWHSLGHCAEIHPAISWVINGTQRSGNFILTQEPQNITTSD